MNFDFALFFTALGLAAAIESLPWLISPNSMKNALEQLSQLPEEQLRKYAASVLVFGLIIMWIASSFI